MVFHSQAKNGGNVLAPVFEYHLCIFVHHEVHEGREEKVKCQELLVLIFTILQLSSCSSLPSWCNPALAKAERTG